MINREEIKVGALLEIDRLSLELIAGSNFIKDVDPDHLLRICVVKVLNIAGGRCEISDAARHVCASVPTEALVNVAISARVHESANESANKKTEQVSHPSHYAWLKDLCGVEPLDICRHLNFNTGNAIKYLLRKDKVDGNKTKTEKRIEDLRKAVFYIQDEIKLLEHGTD